MTRREKSAGFYLVIILRYSFASVKTGERVVKKIILLILIVIALTAGGIIYWIKAVIRNAFAPYRPGPVCAESDAAP